MANVKNPCWCENDIECTQLYCKRNVDCRFKDKFVFDHEAQKENTSCVGKDCKL